MTATAPAAALDDTLVMDEATAEYQVPPPLVSGGPARRRSPAPPRARRWADLTLLAVAVAVAAYTGRVAADARPVLEVLAPDVIVEVAP